MKYRSLQDELLISNLGRNDKGISDTTNYSIINLHNELHVRLNSKDCYKHAL